MRRMVVATSNKGKLKEIREILADADVELLSLADFPGLKLPPEDGRTFSDNALIKARYVSRATGLAALADDSGLMADALGGRPGVFSARYAGPRATDAENRAKLISELSGVPKEGRGARFACSIALVLPDGTEEVFEGRLEGEIAFEERGENGFGYDPVFVIRGRGLTAAEITPSEKNGISHRAEALRKLKRRLLSLA